MWSLLAAPGTPGPVHGGRAPAWACAVEHSRAKGDSDHGVLTAWLSAPSERLPCTAQPVSWRNTAAWVSLWRLQAGQGGLLTWAPRGQSLRTAGGEGAEVGSDRRSMFTAGPPPARSLIFLSPFTRLGTSLGPSM